MFTVWKQIARIGTRCLYSSQQTARSLLPNRIGRDSQRPLTVRGNELELEIETDDGRRFCRRLERMESFAAGRLQRVLLLWHRALPAHTAGRHQAPWFLGA